MGPKLNNRSIILRLFKYKDAAELSMDEFIPFLENSIEVQAQLGGFNCTPGIEQIPTWDDLSYWVIETDFKEDLEYRIKKLEQENIEMTKLAESIRKDIDMVNSVLDRL